MILINALIILLLILIILYFFGKFMKFLSYLGLRVREEKEGLENIDANTNANTDKKKTYTDPGLNDNPLYLATLNAANISYLKDQVDELSGLKQKMTSLEFKVDENSKGITALGEQFSKSAQELTGRDPDSTEPLPMVTGI
jgi:Sec-independent protein translocase protein TatA